ncbi:putative molybdopterin biosynthesis protein [Paucidesulfovibrio gracilis DSM 16080]|uniref:Molybdopterin molybdenumtransferase n=1 Tax=Paucidesulfovibrio gracilis DSM 16080 TaxID=1121449 RepID=A0A1T4Y1H9_9BACT|nr:molybdopterin biosynthesis protein [Paucidesulfovibrio gracilis]SKA95649.1 putative molybdopterin biosynthesis protein [Paucidesulfovibrio gracilis DSM 16080]
MSRRNVYLDLIPPRQAVQRACDALNRKELVQTETIPTHEAAGRTLATSVTARCSSPTFHSAAMDGVAVRAADTFAAREDAPLELQKGRDYDPVNTGNPLPEGRDAVIMIENVLQVDDSTIRIEAPAFPWNHVRRIGEDIVATELLLPQGRVLSAYDVGALLAAGIWEIQVLERLRMTFIPTGDEVLDFSQRPTPQPGQVIESNSQVFASLARSWNAIPSRTATIPDDAAALTQAVRDALASDAHIVVVGAGSSAGSRDYTKAVFEQVGTLLCHGINVMPGKPTLLAEAQGKLLVGAPGYPVSAVICFEDVLAPIAAYLSRRDAPQRRSLPVQLIRRTPSRLGQEEVVRLAVGEVRGRFLAAPLSRGAGMITTLTEAQAVTRIPTSVDGVEAGKTVTAELLVPEAELSRVLIHVGSHDNTLDLLADALMGLEVPLRLTSSHVGSMGGLTAVKNGTALFAGAHLFDPETRDFNFPFLRRYLPNLAVQVVNLAIRHQGLIVPRGNPKGIQGVSDLTRKDIRFINRQRGAGTRILLDHHLEVEGVDFEQVRGYEHEEFTHMAVAVNVLTGAADCGLGIRAAAEALDLDFVPLARERYDLIFPAEHAEDFRLQALLALIGTEAFKQRINNLGGYETTLTGQTMHPGQGLE